ncbi:MAG: carboxypeptidase-like regulatory domain-containing protein [Acidobacteriia bacterium]|nr:carboxypeptidase-like regulatory domain-containing protein [Terriglobia bacterium]
MERFVRWMSAVVVCLVLSNLGFSQASSSSLRGTVTDPSGSALPGATVVITNDASKMTRTATTGEVGDYTFLAMPPGTYTLVVTATGFAHYQQTGIQLLVNTPATANVRLKVGSVTENVNVTGEAPALNLVDASIGNPFNETQVKQLPLEGRNVPDLLSLQAGVVYTGNRPDLSDPKVKDQDTRNGAVNGARSDQSNITLDGVDVNDQSSGYAFTSVLPVTLDSVQEFRVTTSNYNADQGEGSGAQVALVTKSGTNALHGSLYEYHRNTITSASDYFLKQPLTLIRNIFGASVGGPIQKNRLFYFVNYEGTRQREQNSVVRTIPTPSLCAGTIQYVDVNGQTQSLTQTQLSDPLLDPLGLGINPAIENASHTGYFDTTFCTGQFQTNDTSVGDGLNYSGYRFGAPIKLDNNAFIAKIDYHLTADGKHTLFWRGALQNIYNPQEPFLPGASPMQTMTDHSKGFVVGYTAVLNSSMVNSFHWGFTRQSTGFLGNANQEWNTFYGLDQGISYSHNAQTPVHNFLDDFSWTRGKHTLQFGGNIGIVRDPRLSLQHSFSQGKGATNWMSPTGFANTGGGYLDPANIGLPEPASNFQYDYPVLGLLGMVSDVVANYNYDKQGNPLSSGIPVQRNYGLEWYEFYGQDSWRVKPNLTVTYGLRWSLFPPPWEVNGFQASPDVNLGKQFDQIVQNMKQGMGYQSTPLMSFVPGGPANHGPGWYNFEKSDFSPHISVAYSPNAHGGWLRTLFGEGDKTVIRGGYSKVYDRGGMQLLSTFDANPPGGFGATIQNACCTFGYDDAAHVPRITDINKIPTCGPVDNCNDPANQVFFQPAPPAMHPSPTSQAITWGIDSSMKTPYAHAFDFSVGRELPKRFSLQLSYVGRLGRNLLTQRDLRQPLDIVDPISHVDYYAAATALAKVALAHPNSSFATFQDYVNFVNSSINDAAIGPTAAYWHDMMPPLQSGATAYESYGNFAGISPAAGNASLIQAVYDLYYDPFLSYAGNEVVGIGNLDLYGGLGDDLGNVYTFCAQPGCSGLGGGAGNYLNNQATSMFAWSSIGKSSYNALQATLRKQLGSGVQFDLNYTYSKSIDITSSATRLSWASCCNVGAPGTRLANAFDPNGRRGVSDFDTTHQINANWLVELPFGKGKHFAGNASGVADAVIGGWQLSGLARWTSGFPFTVDNGNFWPTNWDEQGIAQMVARPKTGHFRQPNGTISVFANSAAAFADFQHPFPGQSGSRNVVRGDGYAGLDMALNKRWKMPMEGHSLAFRWEVFNVPNLHRFNVASGLQTGSACACIASLQQLPESFGSYTGLLTQPRVMQFALRYEF